MNFGVRMTGYRSDFFPNSPTYHLCDVGKVSNIPNSVSTSRYYKSFKPKTKLTDFFFNSKFKFLKTQNFLKFSRKNISGNGSESILKANSEKSV